MRTKKVHFIDHDHHHKILTSTMSASLIQTSERITVINKMAGLRKSVYEILDTVLYVVLMILGCYFIYKGGVWERFQQKRSDFAEYDEPVSELPTMVTNIRYLNGVQQLAKLGKDYWITF